MHLVEVLSKGPINENLKEHVISLDCFDKIVQTGKGGSVSIRVIVDDGDLSQILADIENKLIDERIVVYDVEAVLPLDNHEEVANDLSIGRFFKTGKEELRGIIVDPVNLSANFIIMVIMSAIVAGIGILQNNVAIIIGAMVIAPFLGPNMLISFGITLGDMKLVYRGLQVAIIATILAVVISILWGFTSSQIHDVPRDYVVSLQDVVLAFACGVAGALSLLSRQGTALVGVMVAAALLPPLISVGLFLGGGYYDAALNKGVLYAINIVCLNLSGIVMFYVSGITPNSWWEREKAKTHTIYAATILTILLIFLSLLIMKISGNI